MELVEKAETGLLAAKLRATCWAGTYRMLAPYFVQETGQSLQAGMQVLVECEVNFHAVYGLSLNIINIDPTFSLGDMMKKRQLTLKRLADEGVMELQSSLTLPTLVTRLAVISSDQAAGYEDFCHQLGDSPYRFSYALFSATMQGEQAERSIIAALDAIAPLSDDFDAVVIIRGGGANTDLGCFDEYNLALHCAQFPIPILTGIGHTRDISIADMVVHLSLKTPTAVAAWLIERMQTQAERLRLLRERLSRTAERQVLIRRHQLEMLEQRLKMCSPERIYQMGYSLMMSNGKVVRSVREVSAGQVVETHLPDGRVVSICQ